MTFCKDSSFKQNRKGRLKQGVKRWQKGILTVKKKITSMTNNIIQSHSFSFKNNFKSRNKNFQIVYY